MTHYTRRTALSLFSAAAATPLLATLPARARSTDRKFISPDYVTRVNAANPDFSYWGVHAEYAFAGRRWDGPDLYRSFLQLPLWSYTGLRIARASFEIDLEFTPTDAPTPVQLWHTEVIDASVPLTWNNSAGNWFSYLATQSAAAFPAGNPQAITFTSPALTTVVQQAIDKGLKDVCLGLRAANESERNQWKRFLWGDAKLWLDVAAP